VAKVGVFIGSATWTDSADSSHPIAETPWGTTSAPISVIKLAGHELLLMPRHGATHHLAPAAINYRANIWQFHHLGVDAIVGTHTVGNIDPDLAVGELVLPNEIIDYTWGRQDTFDDELRHIDFSYPYHSELRTKLIRAAAQTTDLAPFVEGGVLGCTQGPRLETAAEIRRMRSDGCTLVGMTAMPEPALARELEVPYASVCLVVNPAAGMVSEVLSAEAIMAVARSGSKHLQALVRALVQLS
tara:strand:- start:2007 stop:2735 length:729 start_codon:yes stop_codon:yes gene_type:complete